MKLPAIQFYTGDWRKDPGVQSLSYHDRGVWLEMLCLMSESSERGKLLLNGNPMPVESLARILGLDNQILTTTLTTLLTSGVASKDEATGVIYNRRMVRDESIRIVRTVAGKKGGNPRLLNQIPTTMDNQIPTPSSSSSSSASAAERESDYPEVSVPNESEIKAHAQLIGLAEWKALDWFNEMKGCGWLDYQSRPIRDWKAVISRVNVKWVNDGRPSGPPKAKSNESHSKNYSADRNKGTFNEGQAHLYADAAKRQQAARDAKRNAAKLPDPQ